MAEFRLFSTTVLTTLLGAAACAPVRNDSAQSNSASGDKTPPPVPCTPLPVPVESPSAGIFRIPTAAPSQVDLLFVVDDSGSMLEKRQILAKSVPALLERLTSPDCVVRNERGDITERIPASGESCPEGLAPEFSAIEDLHIGVISSSLGSAGGEICEDQNDSALLMGAWWTFVPAGLAIALVGFGLTLLNFGIDEVTNPRLRSEREWQQKPITLKQYME